MPVSGAGTASSSSIMPAAGRPAARAATRSLHKPRVLAGGGTRGERTPAAADSRQARGTGRDGRVVWVGPPALRAAEALGATRLARCMAAWQRQLVCVREARGLQALMRRRFALTIGLLLHPFSSRPSQRRRKNCAARGRSARRKTSPRRRGRRAHVACRSGAAVRSRTAALRRRVCASVELARDVLAGQCGRQLRGGAQARLRARGARGAKRARRVAHHSPHPPCFAVCHGSPRLPSAAARRKSW
jgi:hypothetical protein